MNPSFVKENVKVSTHSARIDLSRLVAMCVIATALIGGALSLVPLKADAASFEVTGWIPYWRTATGTADTLPHLDKLTEVNPFVYTLKQDGTLKDNGELDKEPWLSFIAEAKKKGVRVIPTVMSGDSELMHRILSNQRTRIALEDEITALVKVKGYDGIDIDFEGKLAKTRPYFSTFLKGLYMRMGQKWVMCTIETRLPHADQYYGVPIPPGAGEYSNDLVEINKYCDRVRIMAYDQQGIDRKLQSEYDARGELYAPVGDPAWIEKVVNHMSKDIPKHKMLIGVPTYGYEYAVTAYAGTQYVYDILWTFNPGWAVPLASQYGIAPQRNQTGELYFTYFPNTASTTAGFTLGPNSALLASAAASQFAQANNSNLTFRMMTWPDAQSVKVKVDLAKRLGVRGISIFKFDGGQDPNIWAALAGVATPNTPGTPSSGGSGAVSGTQLTRTLVLGSTGEDVRMLQRILNSDADTRIAASGVGSSGQETTRFAGMTLSAVRKFQVKHGIAQAGQLGYGVVGPMTRAKLNSLLAN
ncbi:MAG TPA: glycosyl hydrolase family 18 protein [Candidatus Paceibacterota bacterium]